VYGTVNVDVSSGLLRPDNASVLKGNILSAWYWFRNIETGQPRKVVWYRVFFALFSTIFSTTTTHQEWSREEVPRLIDLAGRVKVFKTAKLDFSRPQSIE
jgi:hypothetical protein